MKFICEVCGKRHTNITDASECEKACKAKLEESLAKEKEQEDRFKAIGEMVNAYNKDYKTRYYLVDASNVFTPFSALFM